MLRTFTTTVSFPLLVIDEGTVRHPCTAMIEVQVLGSRVTVYIAMEKHEEGYAVYREELEEPLLPGEGAAAFFDRNLFWSIVGPRREKFLRAFRPVLRQGAELAWMNGVRKAA